ncbi:hypothetical protein K437DRAFT_257686, partial [Tilletiaria anomala UBC 951]
MRLHSPPRRPSPPPRCAACAARGRPDDAGSCSPAAGARHMLLQQRWCPEASRGDNNESRGPSTTSSAPSSSSSSSCSLAHIASFPPPTSLPPRRSQRGTPATPILRIPGASTLALSLTSLLPLFFLLLALVPGAQAAPTVSLKVSDPKPCSPMSVSWDTSQGTAPWTLTVAVLNHVQYTTAFPAGYASGNTWTWSWDVPRFKGNTPGVLVAVTDASGKYSAVSRLLSLGSSGGGACAMANESLDFVWSVPKGSPATCDVWKIKFQKETAQPGATAPVGLTFLPIGDRPSAFTTASTDEYDWTVPYPPGTQFTLAVSDAGKAATGGVGLLYTVGDKPKKCTDPTNAGAAVAGIVGATSTAAPGSAPTGKKGGGGSKGSGTSGTNSSSNDDHSAASTGSHIGAAVGGAVAGIIALVLIGVGVWYWRKRASAGGAGAQRIGATGYYGKNGSGAEDDFGNLTPASEYGNPNGHAASGGYGFGGVGNTAAAAGAAAGAWRYSRQQQQQEQIRSGQTFASAEGLSIAGGAGAGAAAMDSNTRASVSGQSTFSHERPLADRADSSHSHGAGGSSVAGVMMPAPPSAVQRSVFSTVPDDHLFPPPRPSQVSPGSEASHASAAAAHIDDHNMQQHPSPAPSSHMLRAAVQMQQQQQAVSYSGVMTTAQLARSAAPSAQYVPSPPFAPMRMHGGSPAPPQLLGHQYQNSQYAPTMQQAPPPPQQQFRPPPPIGGGQLVPIQNETEHGSSRVQSQYSLSGSTIDEGEVIDMRHGYGAPGAPAAPSGLARELDTSSRRQSISKSSLYSSGGNGSGNGAGPPSYAPYSNTVVSHEVSSQSGASNPNGSSFLHAANAGAGNGVKPPVYPGSPAGTASFAA